MAYSKTTWADRIDSGNKYSITDNGDGTKAIEYAGTVTQEGTPVNAQNLNKIEDELEALDGLTVKISADITAIETSPSTAIHAANSYIMYNGELYKVINAIGIGDTLTPGSNIEKKTVIQAIGEAAPQITVDSALSTESENPVQNKVITAEINALKALRLPVQDRALTYNGSVQTVAWDGYDSTKMTRGGTESGTAPGTYNATFTPISPYKWSDDTTAAKNAEWSIDKITATLTLSSTSASLFQGDNKNISFSTNSNGAVSVSTSDSSKVTASVSGSTITLTGGTASGSATVTVTVAEASDYTSVSKTISVSNTRQIIMTVEIDEWTTDPTARCTYKDDAVGMTPGSSEWDSFFGHYPCILTNRVEGAKLDPNDYSKDINGNTVDISTVGNSDVMVCFPRMGLKLSKSGDVLTVSMTNHPNDPNFEYNAHTKGSTALDKFYMGAYLGYISNSKLYSLSGKTPSSGYSNMTRENFRTYAHSRGNGYEQAGFYQLIFMQCVYLLKYKSTDSQAVICAGYTKVSHGGTINTGGADTYGMDCENLTSSQKQDMEHQSKCLGIEDFWGNARWFIDGLIFDSDFNILTANSNFNETGSGYTNNGQATSGSSIAQAVIVTVQGTSKTGFIPKRTSNTTSITIEHCYCDEGHVQKYTTGRAIVGGNFQDNDDAGIFCMFVRYENYSSGLGARLMYY